MSPGAMNPFFPSCSPRFLAEAYALPSLQYGQAWCLTLAHPVGKVGKRQNGDLLFYSFSNKRTCQLEVPCCFH